MSTKKFWITTELYRNFEGDPNRLYRVLDLLRIRWRMIWAGWSCAMETF